MTSTTPALPARGDSLQTWATPPRIVRAIERDSFDGVPFALDCCAQPHTTKAERLYAPENGQDAMSLPWFDATYCNPPYHNQHEWLARAAYFGSIGIHVACLVLASTSSQYWLDLTHRRGQVQLYRGRIAFLDGAGVAVKGASFSSALVLYGPRFPPSMTVRYRDADTGELIGDESDADLFTSTLGGAQK